MKKLQIEVDEDVFQYIKSQADPFTETTPNAVLKRLFGLNSKAEARQSEQIAKPAPPRPTGNLQNEKIESSKFVDVVLDHEFGRGFSRVDRFQYMFETNDKLVYFQNFNLSAERAWFRLNKFPRRILEQSKKKSFVCFTIPPDGEYYLIPFSDLAKQIENAGWSRPWVEVNIDRARSYWTDLGWNLAKYKKHLSVKA